jgi:hypothetical protein
MKSQDSWSTSQDSVWAESTERAGTPYGHVLLFLRVDLYKEHSTLTFLIHSVLTIYTYIQHKNFVFITCILTIKIIIIM